jgi:hypothetical protein
VAVVLRAGQGEIMAIRNVGGRVTRMYPLHGISA